MEHIYNNIYLSIIYKLHIRDALKFSVISKKVNNIFKDEIVWKLFGNYLYIEILY
jgi:hypothetical protein